MFRLLSTCALGYSGPACRFFLLSKNMKLFCVISPPVVCSYSENLSSKLTCILIQLPQTNPKMPALSLFYFPPTTALGGSNDRPINIFWRKITSSKKTELMRCNQYIFESDVDLFHLTSHNRSNPIAREDK